MRRTAEAPRNFVANVTEYGNVKGVVTQSTTSFLLTCLRVAKKILSVNSTIAIPLRTNASFAGVQLTTSTTLGSKPSSEASRAEWAVPEITRTSASVLSPLAISDM